MPNQYRAESAVRVANPSGDKLDEEIGRLADIIGFAAMTQTNGDIQVALGSQFVGGLEAGLHIAVEHPELAAVILGHIDANKGLHGDGGVGSMVLNATARGEAISGVVEAAGGGPLGLPRLGFEPPEVRWN